ncbi:VOC family protein [Mycobacterium sp. C31M]
MSIRLGAVAIDCPDPRALGDFYRAALGYEEVRSTPDLVVLAGPAMLLTSERIPAHRPPTWPAGTVPKQLHLDLSVDDLDIEQRRLVDLGATVADVQPDPAKWRVLLDPVGHPFCLTAMF